MLTISDIITGNATIAGSVFYDRNGNGHVDSGEAGLAGRTLFLDLDHDGKLDENEILAVTDADGNFSFDEVPGGTYDVRWVPSTGWKQTTPAGDHPFTVTVPEHGGLDTVKFGVKRS